MQKRIGLILFCIFGFLSISKSQTSVDAAEFSKQIEKHPKAVIIDVRTPGEYEKGYIKGAINADIRSGAFDAAVSKLDKNQVVLLYCGSGGRSRSAMKKLTDKGFKTVYELQGGLIKWRAAGLPEVSGTATVESLTKEKYETSISKEPRILVQFYAEWCGPCRKLSPVIEKIDKDGVVKVWRINVDDDRELMKELGVTSVPTLVYYKANKQIWRKTGTISEAELRKALRD